jgi:hypothetical protein
MVRMHVNGLKRMVSLRGGLSAIRETNSMLGNIIFGLVRPTNIKSKLKSHRTTMAVMTEPQFPPEPGELSQMLSQPSARAPSPCITDFESLGVSPPFAIMVRGIQLAIRRVDIAINSESPYFCSGQLTHQLLYLPSPSDEGPLTRSISEACRWSCALAAFLPFVKAYPNPSLLINSVLHKLKASLADMLEVAPPDHALLPWLFSVGGLVAVPPERCVSAAFSVHLFSSYYGLH